MAKSELEELVMDDISGKNIGGDSGESATDNSDARTGTQAEDDELLLDLEDLDLDLDLDMDEPKDK